MNWRTRWPTAGRSDVRFGEEWKDLRLRFFWLTLPRLSSESVADALALRGPLLLSASKRTRALSKNAAETRCQSAKPAGA